MTDLLEEILTRLTLLDSQMKSPYSEFYCSEIARKVEQAAELVKEAAEGVKK